MSDIVDRLRMPRTEQGGLWPHPNLHEEAAAEIEKLRAALRPFADAADDFITEKHDAHRAIVTLGDLRAAAAALKETGDE